MSEQEHNITNSEAPQTQNHDCPLLPKESPQFRKLLEVAEFGLSCVLVNPGLGDFLRAEDINKREDKPIHYQTIKTNPIQSLKRAHQRTMMMRIFIIQVHDPVIHLEVDEEQSHKAVRGKRKELGSSLHTCQGYDAQMLLMHGLSYGPALTRNTKERAPVCQSDQVDLRPPRVILYNSPAWKMHHWVISYNSPPWKMHHWVISYNSTPWKMHHWVISYNSLPWKMHHWVMVA